MGSHPELVEARFRGKKGARPADRKTSLVDFVSRNPTSPVEIDGGIDPFQDVLFLLVHLFDIKVAPSQAPFWHESLGAFEGLNEVRCRLPELFVRQP